MEPSDGNGEVPKLLSTPGCFPFFGAPNEQHELRGLRGWLGLLTILVAFGALRILYFTNTETLPMFWNGTWTALTSEGSELYHPLWGPILFFELAGNICLGAYGLFVFLLFFRESAAARPHFNTYALAGIVLILIDAGLIKVVVPNEPAFDPITSKELGRAFGFAAIWITYLHQSVRVRNTLVR
jgi:hypothetical protein